MNYNYTIEFRDGTKKEAIRISKIEELNGLLYFQTPEQEQEGHYELIVHVSAIQAVNIKKQP